MIAKPIPDLITEKEAAKLLGLSTSWMQRKRWEGGGPCYVKFDHAVRYKPSDIEAWIESHANRRSTSDRSLPNQNGGGIK
jgi:predicted DNA-binding transcriptional regulator AlpA